MGKSNEEIVENLTQAAAGLLYMSEADYPFEVIQWGANSYHPGLHPQCYR